MELSSSNRKALQAQLENDAPKTHASVVSHSKNKDQIISEQEKEIASLVREVTISSRVFDTERKRSSFKSIITRFPTWKRMLMK